MTKRLNPHALGGLKRFYIPRYWSLQQRIDFFVDRSSGPGTCWPWTGRINRWGYGRLMVSMREYLVHRVAWEMARGTIPDGLFVCHRCDNPRCCNPEHLFLGTAADNNADMVAKRRNRRGQNHQNAKLTDAQVLAIRADCRSSRAIAAEYGVSDTTICLVKKGVRQLSSDARST